MSAQCRGGARESPRCRSGVLLAILVWAGVVALAASAAAGTPIPYSGAFRAEIEESFFEPVEGALDGLQRIALAKVLAYREQLEKKKRFIEAHVAEYERLARGRSAKRARKAAKGTDLRLALRVAIQQLDRMTPDADPREAYEAAANVLTLDFATRSYTVTLSSLQIPNHLKNILSDWSVPRGTSASAIDAEAGNLWNPSKGDFYSGDELAALVRGGSDLSELNPLDATPFWRRKRDISKVDIVSNYFEGGDPVHEGIVTRFPPFDGAVLDFEKVHVTQSKPKIDVTYTHPDCLAAPGAKASGCKRRIKLKFGMEVHADPPANALLAALGFNVDISKHMQNVRVNLGDVPIQQVEKEWASYFDRQRLHIYYPLDTVLAPGSEGRGHDEQGDYLVFRHAVAEVKDPDIERVGFFGFGRGVASNAREARGLFIFNAWIANADMKDEENNKLSLRRDETGEWRIYLTQQDLGHSFGYVLPEKVDAFPWDLVDRDPFSRAFGALRNRIELTYIDLQDNGLEETTTYADAKWMVRLIAQLTREQIDTAVRLGHWPDPVARLYVEKLINRRNQLLEAFELSGDFAAIPADRGLTTADGAVIDGVLVKRDWPGTHMRFGQHWRDLLAPVGRVAVDTGIWAIQAGVGSVDRIDPGRFRLSGPVIISPEVLLDLDRSVTLNPDPVGRFDQYIVHDSVALGADIAVGFFASAEGSWIKRYALTYPVATRAEGLRGGNRLLSALMPTDVRRGELPDQYVLLREDEFAAGARVSSDDSGTLFDVLGGAVSFNKVIRRRSVIDRRGEVPLVWVDRPDYWRLLVRAFLKAEVFEIPIAWGEVASGEIEGVAWRLDPERLETVGMDGMPIFDRMLRLDDPSELGAIQLEAPSKLRVGFDTRRLRWTLFFFSADREVRDQIITRMSPAGAVRGVELRVARRRTGRWQFIDNGEDQTVGVTGRVRGASLETVDPDAVEIVVRYDIDDLLTHNDEFDDYYDLLAGVGVLKRSIARDFDAADWEVSGEPGGRWVRLLTRGDLHYRGAALTRLLALQPEAYWPQLANELGVSPRRIRRLVAAFERANLSPAQRAVLDAKPREQRAITQSLAVFSWLARARAAGAVRERLNALVAALDRANFKYGQTFDPCIMAALHESIGIRSLAESGDVSMRGGIARATDDENNLPERRAVIGSLGGAAMESASPDQFFPVTGLELYHMLDWVRAEAAVQ